MSLPKAYLSTNLAEPPPTIAGGELRTIGDAIAYMTALRRMNGGCIPLGRLLKGAISSPDLGLDVSANSNKEIIASSALQC